MIEHEIGQLSAVLPAKVEEVLVDQNDMIIILTGDFSIHIKCDFELLVNGVTYDTLVKHPEMVNMLNGSIITNLDIYHRIEYPDLIVKFDRAELKILPDSLGEEMWYIDSPNRVFITP